MSEKKTIINPQTSRPILVGGETWRKLVNNKVIDGKLLKPANEVYEAETEEEAKATVKFLKTKQVKPNVNIRRHNKQPNKIVEVKKRLTHAQIEEYMKKISIQVMKREKTKIADMDESKIEDYLSEQILNEMLSSGKITEKDLDRFSIKETPAEPDVESESESGTEYESESE